MELFESVMDKITYYITLFVIHSDYFSHFVEYFEINCSRVSFKGYFIKHSNSIKLNSIQITRYSLKRRQRHIMTIVGSK